MKLLCTITLFSLLLLSCEQGEKQSTSTSITAASEANASQFINKYAGGYMIEVTGVSSEEDAEGYALKRDGTAKWMWIKNNGSGGAVINSEKAGTWTAEDGKIVVSINGNSGLIQETWLLENGLFYDAENHNRHLKTQ